MALKTEISVHCYHCGEDCGRNPIVVNNLHFCCAGCRCVYEILDKSGMCNYYQLNHAPGASQRKQKRADQFAYLDESSVIRSLVEFQDATQTHVTFFLPQIHCSSCLWLLEHLHKIHPSVISSKTHFIRKEIKVVFDHHAISLRQVAELLTDVGYEPYISLNDLKQAPKKNRHGLIFKLGVAGFCFANIMLFSFPEYLGIDMHETQLLYVFRYLNLALGLPVLLYSASAFYVSAWQSLKRGFLNIDAPIVLAIAVTFGRSVWEICTGYGSGYLDSMSGIVFFMLVGRFLQTKTYAQLNFERDYTSYFPLAATKIKDGKELIITLPEIQLDDTLLIHTQELIPADSILTRGRAVVDYSFVTGESMPVVKEMGEILYAGGRQLEGNIEALVIKQVDEGYLTRLWQNSEECKEDTSFVHIISRYFTLALFVIAFFTAIYWYYTDITKMWTAIASVLIVACPCALLLSNSFTNGYIINILGKNGCYLRSAQSIEKIASVNHVVFDKTGTLTASDGQEVYYEGKPISDELKKKIGSLASQSTHPASRAIARYFSCDRKQDIMAFKETAGKGIEGIVGEDLIAMGSADFINLRDIANEEGYVVYLAIEGKPFGKFLLRNHYRDEIPVLLRSLQQTMPVSVISGDNAAEKKYLQSLLAGSADILFNQTPESKLAFIRGQQQKGKRVMMIGDGLNDAAALRQAEAGIAVAEQVNTFTPASDAIVSAASVRLLHSFIRFCRANRVIVLTAFILSVLYNLVGLYFATTGRLSPMIAAILMPVSSLSIIFIAFAGSSFFARRLSLQR